ncbi:Uncharacterised protein [Leclercia adecarboxylata]|uniref:Uncharacterized protein n=1 Tax=Leclercia adecarboxylata TaxID=83655 RepID=A0A4U9HDV9_9ENTR|nr:Uncharacterised protein [Leclercia adecarboxylata]
MGNERREIQTRLDQGCHLVPGFEHLAAINTFDEQTLEDDFCSSRWTYLTAEYPASRYGHRGSWYRAWCGTLAARRTFPDPTSKPSVMPSSSITSWRFSFDTSTARVTPILRASDRRYSFTSVITTLRAPTCFATAAAMMPIGPAPETSTSSPTRIERQRRVHRVAERVKDGSQIVGDIVRDFEGVKRRESPGIPQSCPGG